MPVDVAEEIARPAADVALIAEKINFRFGIPIEMKMGEFLDMAAPLGRNSTF